MRTLEHIVTPEDDGRKISRVVRARLQLSYHLHAQLKLQDAILLDDMPVHANHIVHTGQRITVQIQLPSASPAAIPEQAPVEFVYIDQDLFIIDKPAPLSCQSSPKQPTGALENRLAHQFASEPGFVFHPVNRLDKGTSGLMAVARHPHAQMLLAQQLHTGAFLREYLAIVQGIPCPDTGMIDAPIAKADGPTIRREVREDGKPAVTHYAVLQVSSGPLSLVRLRLDTGRTHQIRVHMAHIGCPVLGDFLYGQERAELPGRFALHAHRIELHHPLTGERLSFTSPLPEALQSVFVSGV